MEERVYEYREEAEKGGDGIKFGFWVGTKF